MPAIRPARSHDDHALVEIHREVWSPHNSPAPGPPGHGGTVFDGSRVTVAGTIVAVDDEDAPIGWVAIHQPVPRPSNAHVREISGIAVTAERQREGIANLLLDAASSRAREVGALRLTLRCLATNEAGLSLYEGYGFHQEGRLHGEFLVGGVFVDDLLLALDLRVS